MRLIDAGKLRAEYLGMPNCYNGFSDTYDKAMIVDMVDEQPTIDAVPVVRCKDCKHRQELRECPMYHLNYERYEWQLDDDCDDYTKDDGFCDRGERKDDETD